VRPPDSPSLHSRSERCGGGFKLICLTPTDGWGAYYAVLQGVGFPAPSVCCPPQGSKGLVVGGEAADSSPQPTMLQFNLAMAAYASRAPHGCFRAPVYGCPDGSGDTPVTRLLEAGHTASIWASVHMCSLLGVHGFCRLSSPKERTAVRKVLHLPGPANKAFPRDADVYLAIHPKHGLSHQPGWHPPHPALGDCGCDLSYLTGSACMEWVVAHPTALISWFGAWACHTHLAFFAHPPPPTLADRQLRRICTNVAWAQV
jgi:hypothetical protein